MAAATATRIAASSLLHTNQLSIPHPPTATPKPFFSHLSLRPFHLKIHLSAAPLPARCRVRPLASLDETFPEDSGSEPEEEVQALEVPGGSGPKRRSEEGKLFVGNLAFTVNTPDLEELFKQAGQVIDAAVIFDKRTERSRGFGFVTMGTVEEAKSAIDMFNGSEFQGRTLRVNFPEVPRGAEREVMIPKIRGTYKSFIDSPHKIYVGNLGWEVSSEALREAFSGQPGVSSARVIYERETGRSRGFGFVTFETSDDADAALSAMDGVELEGRPLRVSLATSRAASPTV